MKKKSNKQNQKTAATEQGKRMATCHGSWRAEHRPGVHLHQQSTAVNYRLPSIRKSVINWLCWHFWADQSMRFVGNEASPITNIARAPLGRILATVSRIVTLHHHKKFIKIHEYELLGSDTVNPLVRQSAKCGRRDPPIKVIRRNRQLINCVTSICWRQSNVTKRKGIQKQTHFTFSCSDGWSQPDGYWTFR